MSYVTAHVLDAAGGRPAEGVGVRLEDAAGQLIARAATNADGRVPDLGPERLAPGEYRVGFDSGRYFADRGIASFHPTITVAFVVEAGEAHYHIPLLLSPFAYTTYRGS